MSKIFYTGIGSREEKLPEDVAQFMTKFARFACSRDLILRSGHASGSDFAFELGAFEKCEIYLPWNGFNKELDLAVNHENGNYIIPKDSPTYKKIVDKVHHLGYDKLKDSWKKFHSRNVNQIYGKDVDNPVFSNFVVCWTPDGAEKQSHCNINTGGTGTAISIASMHGIPVFNLKNEDAKPRLEKHCKSIGIL